MRNIIFLIMCVACLQLVHCEPLSTGLKQQYNCLQYNCLSCYDSTSYSCSVCMTGSYLNGGYCYYCQSPCNTCTSFNWCTTCYSGYDLSNGNCFRRSNVVLIVFLSLLGLATLIGIVSLIRYCIKKRQQNKQQKAFAQQMANPNYYAAPSQPVYGGAYQPQQNNFYNPQPQPQYGYAAQPQYQNNTPFHG